MHRLQLAASVCLCIISHTFPLCLDLYGVGPVLLHGYFWLKDFYSIASPGRLYPIPPPESKETTFLSFLAIDLLVNLMVNTRKWWWWSSKLDAINMLIGYLRG
ncbi:hypothetical protein EDD15DRAFT_2296035 [Pisolithus albus]|nr:hypothetical protein EDD15DRAFT_2296035 [Pisolithus albus]